MGVPEMDAVGDLIARALEHRDDAAALQQVRDDVAALTARFPLYPRRLEAGGA
jgi:glycine hydroxymethyltransferase